MSSIGCGGYLIFGIMIIMFSIYPRASLLGLVLIIILWWTSNKNKQRENEQEYKRITIINSDRIKQFNQTKSYDFLKIDEQNNMFKLQQDPGKIFKFDELQEYRIYQDNHTITSGQRGIAINFGGLIIGGNSQTQTSPSIEKIDLVINVTGKNAGRLTYSFIDEPVMQNSEDYRIAIESAERVVRGLSEIIELNSNKL